MAEPVHELVEQTDEALRQAQQTARRSLVPRRVQVRRGRFFLITAAAAFVGYLTLFLLMRTDHHHRTDLRATLLLQRNNHPFLARIMGLVSWFGFRPQSLILPASAVSGLWLLRFRLESFFLIGAWASSFISFFTKLMVKRPRPENPLINVVEAKLYDSSFPSGHTLHYVTFWGFFTYLCFTKIRQSLLRWLTVGITTPIIAFVGPSRIYLGHHWLTDVLASYLLGIAYLIGLISLYRWVRRFLDDPGDTPESFSGVDRT